MSSAWSGMGERLAAVVGAGGVAADFPIGPLTTYRVGGAAALHVTIEDEVQLRKRALNSIIKQFKKQHGDEGLIRKTFQS